MLGEATGIGPELVAKLCAQDKLALYCRPVLIGDVRVLDQGKKFAGVNFPVRVIGDIGEASWDGELQLLDQANLDPADYEPGTINKLSGKATLDMLVSTLQLARQGSINGFVYAPINKEALKRSGYQYEDEGRLFLQYLQCDVLSGEMNVLDQLWTSRVTSHIPLEQVCAKLNIDKVVRAIRLADKTLRQAGYGQPRIAVAAINPHGGEGGQCGLQEIDIIEPAVRMAGEAGISAMGPFPADTIFVNAFKGAYDAVVTMYHDQGQIAMKLMGFDFGVTVVSGLSVSVATPAHGTAFDIVGRGIGNPRALEQAVIIAARMAGWRS